MTRRTPDEWQQWLSEFAQGQNVEAWRGIMCFLRWIQIRAENGHPVPNFLEAMEGDIFHSHLLRRMIAGKDPLGAPPPESFGQPWYEVVERGRGTRPRQALGMGPDQKISVNEGSDDPREEVGEYVVTYRLNPGVFRLHQQPDEPGIERCHRAGSVSDRLREAVVA